MAARLRSSISLFRKILRADSPARHAGIGNPRNLLSQHLRNYATGNSAKEETVKVPLSLFGVSGNYASALFIAASKANSLDTVEKELSDLVAAAKKSTVFSQFVKDLSVPADVRVKAIQEIFTEAKFSDITKNFLSIMAENGRLRHIEKIAQSFSDLTMAHKGEVKVTVTSVIPLPAEEEKDLKITLQEILGQGKTVKVEQKIDPSIMGGLVVEFGQKVFDMSIKTRAKQMERFLREPVNFDSF